MDEHYLYLRKYIFHSAIGMYTTHLFASFACPPNDTTVRMELKTSSAIDPALA